MAERELFTGEGIFGRFPGDFAENRSLALGAALAAVLGGGHWVIGRDNRLVSRSLHWLVLRGLSQSGVQVTDLGVCSTQMLTYAVADQKAMGGILVTGGDRPEDCTGLCLWRKNAVPVGKVELGEIKRLWLTNMAGTIGVAGAIDRLDISSAYIDNLMKYADDLKSFSVMADLDYGVMGQLLPRLFGKLPCELVGLTEFVTSDFGRYGVTATRSKSGYLFDNCNPFSCPQALRVAVRDSTADLGVVFSGDGSRVRMFTEMGEIVPSATLAGLLAGYLLEQEPGGRIVCGARDWRVLSRIVARAGGIAVFAADEDISNVMRAQNAVFGSNGTGAFYLREANSAVNSELALLLVLAVLSREGGSISQLVQMRSLPSCVAETVWTARSREDVVKTFSREFSGEDATVFREMGIAVLRNDWGFCLRPDLCDPRGFRLFVDAESLPLLVERSATLNELLLGCGAYSL